MVLPGAEALTPCLMGKCPPETRKIWKERYRYAKKYGLRAALHQDTGRTARETRTTLDNCSNVCYFRTFSDIL